MNSLPPNKEMRVTVFDQSRIALHVETRPIPQPGEGEVTVRVGRSGICSSEIQWTDKDSTLKSGTVVGHEFAGKIVALGPGMRALTLGDAVSVVPFTGCGYCAACRGGDYLFYPQSARCGAASHNTRLPPYRAAAGSGKG